MPATRRAGVSGRNTGGWARSIEGSSALRPCELDRVSEQVAGGRQAQFALQVFAVGFDRLDADVEQFGDLAIAHALPDVSEDLEFPIAQRLNARVVRRSAAAGNPLHELRGDGFTHVRVTVQNA